MKVKNIDLSDDTLNYWIQTLLPKYDIFFFPRHYEMLMEHLRPNALVMPVKEFFSHKGFNNIDTLNSYELWELADDVAFACVVHPDMITNMDNNVRKEILKVQKLVNRGLVFRWDLVNDMLKNNSLGNTDEINDLLSPYIFECEDEYYLAVQTSLWSSLDTTLKRMFLLQAASKLVDDIKITNQHMKKLQLENPHISGYFNLYSKLNGANCFAATLAATSDATADIDWIISFWVHHEGFKAGLKANKYEYISDSLNDLQPKDVLVWCGTENIIHATYYLGDGFFFNKHGQSFMTPWQIVSANHLYEVWGTKGIELYRRSERNIK